MYVTETTRVKLVNDKEDEALVMDYSSNGREAQSIRRTAIRRSSSIHAGPALYDFNAFASRISSATL